jgi:hypothetical protein
MTVPTSTNLHHDTSLPYLAVLSKRATIDETDMLKYSVKSLIASVGKLYAQVNNAKPLLVCISPLISI